MDSEERNKRRDEMFAAIQQRAESLRTLAEQRALSEEERRLLSDWESCLAKCEEFKAEHEKYERELAALSPEERAEFLKLTDSLAEIEDAYLEGLISSEEGQRWLEAERREFEAGRITRKVI